MPTMKPLLLFIIMSLMVGMVTPAAKAQKLSQRQRRERLDSLITTRYYHTSYDSNYVIRPEGKLFMQRER